jgi:tetratricopeptide (TPR) repeat protein
MLIRLLNIIFFVLVINVVFSQNDVKLQPVEIHPPNPGIEQKPKQESDDQLAAQYFQKKEYDKAVVLYEKLFKKSNNSLNYTYYLYCLIELNDFKAAEKLVKSQIKEFPGKLKYTVDLGYIYSEEGETGKANKQFDETIKQIEPDRSSVIDAGNSFLMRGQLEYAITAYRRGNEIIRDYPFYLELGDLYYQAGNFSMMIDEYLNYIDFNPQNASLIQTKLQTVLSNGTENKISEMLRKTLLKRTQRNPEKVYYSEMLIWLSVQEKDFELAFIQAKSIDRRLGEDGDRIFELAGLSLSNQNYEVAIEAYNYILKKGKTNHLYIDSKIGLLTARYLKITDSYNYLQTDLTNLENDYISTLSEYGENASTIGVMKYLAHLQAFYLDKTSEAIIILNKTLLIPNANPTAIAECKIELADIMLFTGDVWEAKLLYAQVEKSYKNDPIGHMAKFKNAKLSFYIGEFQWAKAQLDVLKAATSKLIANDALQLSVLISDNIDMDSSTVALSYYSRADMLLYQNKPNEALVVLDSIFGLADSHPIFDEVWYKKAEIMIRMKEFEKAAEYLSKIVEDYPYDITADNALFLLADLNEIQFLNKEKALELFEKLLEDYPASVFTVEARKRFRNLRGDFINEGT